MRPPLEYLGLRLMRRVTPQPIIDWMLTNSFLLTPGHETRALAAALPMYRELASEELELEGKSVMIFGYGGTFGLALSLLEEGAGHVYLHDPYGNIRHSRNKLLPTERMVRFFNRVGGKWTPDPRYLTILSKKLPEIADSFVGRMDVILSNSVFEHVDDVPAHVEACEHATKPGGYNLHSIDLRDHFFRYPFEMLRYSDSVWRRWLNASNNLNRWRFGDFEKAFGTSFDRSIARPRRTLPREFNEMRAVIRPEFLSGDDTRDAVGSMIVECWKGTAPSGEKASISNAYSIGSR